MSGLVNVRDHVDPTTASDWQPAFAAAIATAVTTGRGGVFVPASPTPYRLRKPGLRSPSIDLRGLTDFVLVGEGASSRLQLVGSGLGGSWNMILIGGDSVDVTVRDLYLDGNTAELSDLDAGQHTHTIQIGGGNPIESARRVRVLDCTMTDMDGDGVALIGAAEPFGGGRDVSVVDIVGCTFLNCRRSGVSNQRSAEFVRIRNCHFEGTGDQDIDFEPTGTALDSGPRRYSIVGNRFIHSSGAAAVTLSGVAGDIPARDNVFAYNHVYGGRVGMIDTQHVLVVGNYIEGGVDQVDPVLRMRGTTDGARVGHNHIVRVPGAVPGTVIDISSRAVELLVDAVDPVSDTLTVSAHGRVTGTGPVRFTTLGTAPTGVSPNTPYWLIRNDANTLQLAASRSDAVVGTALAISDGGAGAHRLVVVDRPRGVDVSQNRIHSHVAPGDQECTVLFRNAEGCSLVGNEIVSYWSGSVPNAVLLTTAGALRDTATDWVVSGNRIRGDADGGTYDTGVTVSPTVAPVGGVVVSDNSFRGCATQVRWSGTPDSYTDIPTVRGNSGTGTDFAGLSSVDAVRIAGNAESQADYVYDSDSEPTFPAANGSTARRRRGGGVGTTFFVREAGAWRGV